MADSAGAGAPETTQMLVHPDCFPCYLRQVSMALGQIDIDNPAKIGHMKSIMDVIKTSDVDRPPAYATTFIYRKIKQLTGLDPYKEIKHRYNEIAKGIYPDLRAKVFASKDPLWMAARLAIAGNIIDFGIFKSVDIHAAIQRSLNTDIERDDYEAFKQEVNRHKDVLYLLDNAGEIVFDMLLIEALNSMDKHVTAVVKGGPVINDVTLRDAEDVGLMEIARVIDNGSDAVGTILEMCSEEFRAEFNGSSFIISKGQGNFETLMCSDKNIFFLFQAKCDVIASELGLDAGAMILRHK